MTDATTLWDTHAANASFARDAGERMPAAVAQRSVRSRVSLTGVGLHSGRSVTMSLVPAGANTGIVFRRVDLVDGPERDLPVRADKVVHSPLCTTLTNDHGVQVATIEHLMAALFAVNIDNLIIEIDAPELPILDGSAEPFLKLIDQAGLDSQAAARRTIRVLKRVHVEDGQASATLEPAANGLSVAFEIEFPAEAIGHQTCSVQLTERQFRRHIAPARTFCMKSDVDWMHANGLALGGSLDNAIVVNGAEILNDEGLRFKEEFVRHKALDAIGDLYMAGMPITGKYSGVRSGHHVNSLLLKALLADPEAFVIETIPARAASGTTIPFKSTRSDQFEETRACA